MIIIPVQTHAYRDVREYQVREGYPFASNGDRLILTITSAKGLDWKGKKHRFIDVTVNANGKDLCTYIDRDAAAELMMDIRRKSR